MNKEFLIQLTNNLYRLTLLFPKKEPLRYKMREVAGGILVKPETEDLEILDNFFEVAKNQNWVSPQEILAIQQEYANLRGELKQPSFVKTTDVEEISGNNPGAGANHKVILAQSIAERQEKILAFLKENGRAQVWQIKQILPEVTKRTLRRDFENMLGQEIIERVGERNNTFYQLKTEVV